MIGFRRLLMALAEMFRKEPDRIVESSQQVLDAIREQDAVIGHAGEGSVSWSVVERATQELSRRYDGVHGGFGSAPKFPPSMAIHLLMREYLRRGDLQLIEMAERTLQKMALGGMYDQIGGGFTRYSTDERWLVPHFEKMLYDNALLAKVYFDAGALTRNEFYTGIGREILDYVTRDMTDPEGGFYSAEDADSEGEEGKFYVWSNAEWCDVVGTEDADLLCDYFDISDRGNFEGHNIPNVITPLAEFARSKGIEQADAVTRINAARTKLFAHREKRVHPFKDKKVLTSWNGMMISAFCRGAQVTGEASYRMTAERAAQFILDHVRDSDGRLLRTWGGGRAKISAFSDDYAYMTAALIDLYETTFDPKWLEAAEQLANRLLSDFFDAENGAFFTTDGRDATVLLRRKDVYDGATPSGNSVAVNAFLRLAFHLDRADLRDAAMKTISAMNVYFARMSGAVHHLLNAVAFSLSAPKEIAIVGDLESPKTRELLGFVWGQFLPDRVLAARGAKEDTSTFASRIALLRGKTAAPSEPSAFVCQNYTCSKPVHTVDELRQLLK